MHLGISKKGGLLVSSDIKHSSIEKIKARKSENVDATQDEDGVLNLEDIFGVPRVCEFNFERF